MAHLIDFLNRLFWVNPPKNPQNHNWLKIHPANLGSALPIGPGVLFLFSANTVGFGEGFAMLCLCLFVKTSLIN
jgi:hypothetical protein